MTRTDRPHRIGRPAVAIACFAALLIGGCGSTPEPSASGSSGSPGSSSTPPAKASTPPATARPEAPKAGAGGKRPNATAIRLMRPAAGPTVDGFDGKGNKGIDIGGKAGDPVWAAADGQVVYVGSQLRGYGNMVIVKHNDTFLTAYAHNRAVLVAEKATVKRGQKIAEMGSSGTNRVKLHFELRRDGTAVNPVPYLDADAPR